MVCGDQFNFFRAFKQRNLADFPQIHLDAVVVNIAKIKGIHHVVFFLSGGAGSGFAGRLGLFAIGFGHRRLVGLRAPPGAERPIRPHELEYERALRAAANQRFHDGLRLEHLGQVRQLGERAGQVFHAPAGFPALPQVVGAVRQQRLGGSIAASSARIASTRSRSGVVIDLSGHRSCAAARSRRSGDPGSPPAG